MYVILRSDWTSHKLLTPSDAQELPTLTPEDVALVSSLHKNVHYCQAPGPKERDGHKLCMGWTYEQMGW